MKYHIIKTIDVEIRLPCSMYLLAKRMGVDRGQLRRVLIGKEIASHRFYKKIVEAMEIYKREEIDELRTPSQTKG